MYLIAALKACRPRHDAAMCSVSSEGLPAALSCGRRQERKKEGSQVQTFRNEGWEEVS